MKHASNVTKLEESGGFEIITKLVKGGFLTGVLNERALRAKLFVDCFSEFMALLRDL